MAGCWVGFAIELPGEDKASENKGAISRLPRHASKGKDEGGVRGTYTDKA